MADCTNPIDSITLENGESEYTITLCSVICNSDNTQTWTYYVEEISGKNISNWALELCDNITVINSDPETEEIGPPGGGEGNCLNGENTCDEVSYQIKWNLDSDFTSGTFSFTLNSCYQCKKVHTAIKAGTDCFCGLICGPCCDDTGCIDCNSCGNIPPTRGILFI